MKKRIVVTGVAGFIGSNLAKAFLDLNYEVIGLDNINDYYSTELKKERLSKLENPLFTFYKLDISDKEQLFDVMESNKPIDLIVNLAAQAGVRYSIENPDVYIESNLIGFYNILETCRRFNVPKLIYASSSSVYGSNKKVPFEESDNVDHPVSLYAATKKSNELLAECYSHLYGFQAIGLRFFTVYGPMGRPDMAYFSFTDKFFNDEAIDIYNNGDFSKDLYRDFTYIDDIISGIVRLNDSNIVGNNELYNIGNNEPVTLMNFIYSLENALSSSLNRKVEFKKNFMPIKPGDVKATYASIDKLKDKTGYSPTTQISEGLRRFTDWYVEYYNKK